MRYFIKQYPPDSHTAHISGVIELICRRRMSLGATGDELAAGLSAGVLAAVKDAEYVLGKPENLRQMVVDMVAIMLLGEPGGDDEE